MQHNTVYLYLEIALHVSGGVSTHHQEHTQFYLQHLALVKPLLIPAAIVEELEHHQEHTQLYLQHLALVNPLLLPAAIVE